MSTPTGAELAQQLPQNPTLVNGICQNPLCKTPLEVPYPPIRVLHDAVADVVVIPHTLGVECIKCGQYYNIAITQLVLDLGLFPMPKPEGLNEEKRIIEASNIIPFTR
jgi:hypothetical protein